MVPFLSEYWGNPSSAYRFGKAVATDIKLAREKVAALINADPREIIFTSCGTESNNSALHSALVTQPGQTPCRHHRRRAFRQHQILRLSAKARL